MKCYYCTNKAIHIKSYTDDVDGISYEYPHCHEHRDIEDHSQYALDLWKLHQEEQGSQSGYSTGKWSDEDDLHPTITPVFGPNR